MKLYEIDTKIIRLINLYENGEIDLDTYIDTMSSLEFEQNEKIDNIACYIKQLIAEEKALKEEVDILNKRRKNKQNTIEKLKEYISNSMKINKIDRLETSRNIINFRKTPSKVILKDEKVFIEWAKQNKKELLNFNEPTVNKALVKEFLTQNKIEGAELKSDLSLQIK